MKGRRYSVGYYGIPGDDGRQSTLVHLHDAEKRGPACGVRLRASMEFQWCSWNTLSYIECRTCQHIAKSIEIDTLVRRLRAVDTTYGRAA